MKSTDDDVLLNGLRLLMTIVAPNVSDSAQIGKVIAEQGEQEVIIQLIKIVKEGPSISFTQFNHEITLISINLLRAFIQHSNQTKKKIMSIDQRT